MTDGPSRWSLGRRTVTMKTRNRHLKQKSFNLNIKSTRVAKLMSVFSPRKSRKNHPGTSPNPIHNSSTPMDSTEALQSTMDVDDPPVDSPPPLDRADSHPRSNTAEMEAAWTNCARRVRVEDVSDEGGSDSDDSESIDLDSDLDLFGDDEDENDENKGTHQCNFGDLGLGFQLRAAQAGMLWTWTEVRVSELKQTHQPDHWTILTMLIMPISVPSTTTLIMDSPGMLMNRFAVHFRNILETFDCYSRFRRRSRLCLASSRSMSIAVPTAAAVILAPGKNTTDAHFPIAKNRNSTSLENLGNSFNTFPLYPASKHSFSIRRQQRRCDIVTNSPRSCPETR